MKRKKAIFFVLFGSDLGCVCVCVRVRAGEGRGATITDRYVHQSVECQYKSQFLVAEGTSPMFLTGLWDLTYLECPTLDHMLTFQKRDRGNHCCPGSHPKLCL